MSVRVMSEVWDMDLPLGRKMVLLALADHADDEGRNAYPSVDRIANKCSMDRRTVQRQLRSLETDGLIVVERVADQRTPTVYRLVRGGTVPQGRHSAAAAMDPVRGGAVPPNPSLTTKTINKGRPSKRVPQEFVLTEERKQFAVKAGITDVVTTFGAFVDHEFKDARSDWDAAWRNWCRNEVKFRPQRAPNPPDTSRRNSLVPEHARQNIPSADETRARIKAEDEERRRLELRQQLKRIAS